MVSTSRLGYAEPLKCSEHKYYSFVIPIKKIIESIKFQVVIFVSTFQ